MDKTVINNRFKLEDSFQETLYLIDAWIKSIESQYINFSTYRPLSGSFYMDLPTELRNPKKGLINLKNEDQNGVLLDILILQKNI